MTSAVAFVSTGPPSEPRSVGGDHGGGGGRNSGSGGRAARRGGGGGSGDAAASNADGESYCSSGSEGGLGSSWGSVSDLAAACVADTAHDAGGRNRWGGGVNGRADDDDDDDDEVVRKGIWFPPPSTAGAQDPLLASSTTRTASSPATGAGPAPAARITQAAVAGSGRSAPPQRPAFSAPPDGDDEQEGEVEDTTRRIVKGREERSSPRATTLAGRLRRWQRFGAPGPDHRAPPEPPATADKEADDRRRRCRSPGREGLDATLPLSSRGGGGGGDSGSEFVVLVSREATVRELAASVGEFPPEWLVGAFGLVVRRQVEGAVYDARARAAMKRAVGLLEGKVSWKQVSLSAVFFFCFLLCGSSAKGSV